MLLATPLLSPVGCSQAKTDTSSSHGDVYYLDGAGGGGLVRNWGRGVKSGLEQAGFNGEFIESRWETGLGVMADQVASEDYKRQKGAEVATMIRKARDADPQAPITLMGLSAGTAVAIFALEALPANYHVDNVILLGASIASDHDISRALSHVNGRLYLFTSEKDAVLSLAVPVAGTADREAGTVPAAGLRGFSRRYAKVAVIPWQSSFAKDGNFGGHTDTTQPRFVKAHIAPLVMRSARSSTASISQASR